MGRQGSDGSEGSEGSEAKEGSEKGIINILQIEPPTCAQEVSKEQNVHIPLSQPLNIFSF